MSKGALIIGGSVAGIQAALDLADSGIPVHIVEPTPFLGSGNAPGPLCVPEHVLNARLLAVAKHPRVTVWTNTRVTRIEGPAPSEREAEAGRYYVELRQHPRYVDLSRCTACRDCISVCPVTVPGTHRTAIYLPSAGLPSAGLPSAGLPPAGLPPAAVHSPDIPLPEAAEVAQPGCAAIDKLGKAPCSNACPGGIHVQGYVALIAQGRFQEAIDLIREAIPFPGICGRICTHPCEVNCRRAEVDKPVSIRLLKRFVSDWELEYETRAQQVSTPVGDTRRNTECEPDAAKRIAVVGAGPGGMAVAERLARLGYRVTVFEKLPVIGGMMAVGIPEYRLPHEIISREYQQIQDLGVELRLNTTIGPDGEHTLADLFTRGHEAICLAIGAHRSHALRISGEELPGVVQGIELLTTISLSQQLNDPQYGAALQRLLHRGADTRVAVLGGGNTAMDVARSLKRLSVQDVRILYRRTRAEMPALPEEIEETENEGVPIEFLVAPVRVLGDAEGGVAGLECQRMKLGEPDASGRRRPVPIAGSEFIIDLDLVVLAVGQAPDLDALGLDLGSTHLAITREERINVDGVSFMTNLPGVFAVGDAVTTDKMAVIEAIGMGKKAAAAIDTYLHGLQPHEVVVDAREVPIARRDLAPEELAPKPRIPVPTIHMARRLSSYAEVELGYSAEQAILEAQRCLVCGPCSECLACVRACKAGAIVHEQSTEIVPLQIGAVIYAGEPAGYEQLSPFDGQGLYRAQPDSALHGSAAAAQAMFDLFADSPGHASAAAASPAGTPRIGVFVCQCGDQIARVVDTETVRQRAALWPDVVQAQVLPFSCSPEGAETIHKAITDHELNRVVLAACSCCSIDQVCYSCTYQRIRCKDNLGVFLNAAVHTAQPVAAFEFVNIREQCAWVHASDPGAATAKATALVAVAAARARAAPLPPQSLPLAPLPQPVDRSVLILGSGAAAIACQRSLSAQGIAARRVPGTPSQVVRTGGRFRIVQQQSDHGWQGSAVVLAPRNANEAEQLLAAFGEDGQRPRPQTLWGGLDTHRPGVLICDPALPAETAGAAAAARATAWLGRSELAPSSIVASVDSGRCRACNTCVELCEFGAAQLVGQDPQRSSWIDPAICTGCGTCAAHCPSGAITAGYATDAQLEAALQAALI